MPKATDNQPKRESMAKLDLPMDLPELRGFYRLANSGERGELVVYVLGDTESSEGD